MHTRTPTHKHIPTHAYTHSRTRVLRTIPSTTFEAPLAFNRRPQHQSQSVSLSSNTKLNIVAILSAAACVLLWLLNLTPPPSDVRNVCLPDGDERLRYMPVCLPAGVGKDVFHLSKWTFDAPGFFLSFSLVGIGDW